MRPGYIYFIRVEYGDRPIKIGYTRNPTVRLSQLQQWSPWPLKLLALFECSAPEKEEWDSHQRLAAMRLRGEWYVGSDEVKNEISRLSKQLKRTKSEPKDLREKRRYRSEVFKIRVTPADEKRWRGKALKQNKSLSAWIRDILNDDYPVRKRADRRGRSSPL